MVEKIKGRPAKRRSGVKDNATGTPPTNPGGLYLSIKSIFIIFSRLIMLC